MVAIKKTFKITSKSDFKGFFFARLEDYSHSVFNVKCIKQNAILSRELKQYTEQ